MNQKETSLTVESLVDRINTELLLFLVKDAEYSVNDLAKALKYHQGEMGLPDYRQVESRIESLSYFARKVGLTGDEFVALFGRGLEELIFESVVHIGESETGTHTAIQLYHRNHFQVCHAHGILVPKGVRFDTVVPETKSTGERWGTFTILLSAQL